jgi:hypothetical protein
MLEIRSGQSAGLNLLPFSRIPSMIKTFFPWVAFVSVILLSDIFTSAIHTT